MATLKPLSCKGSHSDKSCLRPRGHISNPDCCSVDGPLIFLFCCPDGHSLQACMLGCHLAVPMCTFNCPLRAISLVIRTRRQGLSGAIFVCQSGLTHRPLCECSNLRTFEQHSLFRHALMTTARAQHCKQWYTPGRTGESLWQRLATLQIMVLYPSACPVRSVGQVG